MFYNQMFKTKLDDIINSNVQIVINSSDLVELSMLIADKIISQKESAKAEDENILLSRAEVCEVLGKTLTTLWKWDKIGYLKPIRVGSRAMYRKGDVLKIMEGKL